MWRAVRMRPAVVRAPIMRTRLAMARGLHVQQARSRLPGSVATSLAPRLAISRELLTGADYVRALSSSVEQQVDKIHRRMTDALSRQEDTVWGSAVKTMHHSACDVPDAVPEEQNDALYQHLWALSESGCAKSQSILGHWHLTAPKDWAPPCDRNRSKALHFLEAAAAQGDACAAFSLAECHTERTQEEEAVQGAVPEVSLVQIAAEGGLLRAQYQLALYYWEGESIRRSSKRCRYWLECAAERDYLPAIARLGELLTSPDWRKGRWSRPGQDFVDAKGWLTIASERGDVTSTGLLAQTLLMPYWRQSGEARKGGDSDTVAMSTEEEAGVREGWGYLRLAAERGHILSTFNLSVALEYGEADQPAPDLAAAHKWLLQMTAPYIALEGGGKPAIGGLDMDAYEKGALSQAMWRLTEMYARGVPGAVIQNMTKAVVYCKAAVDRGHVDACWKLATMYRFGVPGALPADHRVARRLGELAANRGSKQAEAAMMDWDEMFKKEQDSKEESNANPPDSDQFCLPFSLKEELKEAAADGDSQAIQMLMQAEEGERSGATVWVPDAEYSARQTASGAVDDKAKYEGMEEEETEATGLDQFDYYCEELAEDTREMWQKEDGNDVKYDYDTDDEDDDEEGSEFGDPNTSDEEADIDTADYDFDGSDDDRDKDGSYLTARRALRTGHDSVSNDEEELRIAVEKMSSTELEKLLRGR